MRTAMRTDYLDAFARHWQDAEALFTLKRWANAEHLHGIAAECGLKRLMVRFGMPLDQKSRPSEQEDRTHIDRLWGRYSRYLSGAFARAYSLPTSEPFSRWRASDRYCHQCDFTESRAVGHRNGAIEVKRLIDKALRERLL